MVNKFTKPPLSKDEKEKKAEEFINFSPEKKVTTEVKKENEIPLSQKEDTKPLLIRAPISYRRDLQEIMNLTGLTMNAICLELLRPAIKRKLKELKED